MKRFSEQFYKKSLSVKLQTAEKKELRERVVSYMEYHPLPGAKSVAVSSLYTAESFRVIPFSYITRFGAAVAVFLLIVIPTLAERAVPGDGLYAIKVSFNEEVRGTLALTPHQKIEWETERLNRRIAEARLLASEGRLTEEVEVEVAAAVKTHTENAKREIEALRTEDAEEANLATIEFSSTLAAQATALMDSDEDSGDRTAETRVPTSLIAFVVGEAATQETVGAGIPSYERLLARVETNTTRVRELFEALDLGETSPDYHDILRRTKDIERSVEEAVAQHAMSDEGSRMMLVNSLRRTQTLIVYLTEYRAGQEFEVGDFVPVVLTPEEEKVRIAELETELQAAIASVESQLASSTNTGVNAKAEAGLATLYDFQADMTQTTSLTEVEKLHEQATVLFADINMLFAFSASTEGERATSTEETTETPAAEESSN